MSLPLTQASLRIHSMATAPWQTAKPDIRRHAQQGDWIVGPGSKRLGRQGHLVYAMRITETKTFDDYWDDPRFLPKRPDMRASPMKTCGDNIYYHDKRTGERRQVHSLHSNDDGTAHEWFLRNDTKSDRVLISNDFVYWGGRGLRFPVSVASISVVVEVTSAGFPMKWQETS